MAKVSYGEKLKNPLWQKKRLEIMQRDDFRCHQCLDSKSTLNVHHKKYIYGRDPWEYDNKYLVTLCDRCHDKYHKYWKDCENNLIDTLKNTSMQYYDLQIISQAIINIGSVKFIEMCAECLTEDQMSEHTHPVPSPLQYENQQ